MKMTPHIVILAILFFVVPVQGEWKMHTIDDGSRGADGVRVSDVNGDGLMDFVTGWEEGGEIRVYLNPGKAKVKQNWPRVTVGKVKSPEDAVFVDVDGDGVMDVVSSCEGKTQSMFVHWGPKEKDDYMNAAAWKTERFEQTRGVQWMFALPMQVDGKHGVDLIIGSKGKGASVSWLESPKNARDLSAWKLHRITDAGWVMSLQAIDLNADGVRDVLVSDRKGKGSGIFGLFGEVKDGRVNYRKEYFGGRGKQVMFVHGDIIPPGKGVEIVGATWGAGIIRLQQAGKVWRETKIEMPYGIRTGKASYFADMNGDGQKDVVFSAAKQNLSRAEQRKYPGVCWFEYPAKKKDGEQVVHPIADVNKGLKFDLIQTIDLDGDGDLDVITCEERDNLGLIWYENPSK